MRLYLIINKKEIYCIAWTSKWLDAQVYGQAKSNETPSKPLNPFPKPRASKLRGLQPAPDNHLTRFEKIDSQKKVSLGWPVQANASF